eukprot:152560-Rhodomonas_salina.2
MTKITDLPSEILHTLWPADKTVMGTAVCRRFRDILPMGAKVMLRTHSDTVLNLRNGSLLRFKGKVDLGVSCVLPKTSGKQMFPCQVYPIRALEWATEHGWHALSRLDLAGNEVKLQGIKKLCVMLPLFDSLTHLNLRGNKICVAGARHLTAALPQCASLTHLDLGNNILSSSGASQIAAILPICRISSLDLSANAIGCGGAIKVAQSLPLCDQLTDLDLSSNDIYSEGCRHLALALPLCITLSSFSLGANRILDAGANYLTAELPSCPNLTDLNLAKCSLSPSSQEKLVNSLPPNIRIDLGWDYSDKHDKPIRRRLTLNRWGEEEGNDTDVWEGRSDTEPEDTESEPEEEE